MSGEKLPPLPLPHPQTSYSSGGSSPRVGSIASSISSHSGSQSSFTSAASSNGPKTPSPILPVSAGIPGQAYDHYPAMSQPQDMYYSQHMSAGQAPPPQTVTSGGMSHYPHQPPLLQPGPAQYPNPPAPYSHQYGYANGMTSPPTAPPVSGGLGSSGLLPGPGSLPGMPGQPTQMQNQYTGFDTTGQIAPPGMKPRVTATLWEDEGSLCFQVEARGICVARREDNHMINGTKLLNVAGMTRGRRDGILKSEKVRHVVKIGPMHLKGVWIPFERALDFANKEKITELLYPLFVHNIGALLYHPTNQNRTSQVMAAHERRKQEQSQQIRNSQPTGPGLPSIHQHHHSMALPPAGPQPSLPSQSSMGRPALERAQTFPTPPTSASSAIGSMGASDGFWAQQQQGMSGAQGTAPMTVDTSLSNARSMPNTPATTPPGNSMQSMQPYSQGTQSFDSSRQMYSNSTQQSPYQTSAPAPQDRNLYGQQSSSYGVKSEMGPPSSRPAGGPGSEQQDTKPPNGVMHSDQSGQAAPHHEDEADHEHETEYTHDSGYDANRTAYNYSAPVGSMPSEHTQLSPEMTGSPHHPPTSGRATPRTAAAPQPYYSQPTGYQSPPRIASASNNVYNVMNNDRGTTAPAPSNDVYAPQADMGSSMTNGYSAQPAVMNGVGGGIKRSRDEEDDRSSSDVGLDLKRRKTLMDSSVSAPPYDAMNRPGSAVPAPRRSLMI